MSRAHSKNLGQFIAGTKRVQRVKSLFQTPSKKLVNSYLTNRCDPDVEAYLIDLDFKWIVSH